MKRKTLNEESEQPTKQFKSDKSKEQKELYKPLTVEELNRLKETQHLYNSNLFRLQIDELLSEVAIKEKRVNQINEWMQKFKNVFKKISAVDDVNLSEIVKQKLKKKATERQLFIDELYKNKINLESDNDMSIKFHKPENFRVIGEYKLNCATKVNLHLDISIKIPSTCFYEKDYLNNRYFLKRHYYLVFIYFKLMSTDLCSKMDISFKNNVKLFPFIKIVPNFYDKLVINIFLSGDENSFKLNRFLPFRSNVKMDLDNVQQKSIEHPTPIYNSILAKDMSLHINHTSFDEILKMKNVQDGIKLLNVWLNQRELNKGIETFDSEIILFIITYMISHRKINQHMSSFQIIRTFWTFLSSTNWHKEPVAISGDVKHETFTTYKKYYDVVFLDVSGIYNVTSFVNINVYFKLRRESKLALAIIDENRFDSFSALFIKKLPLALQYDMVVRLHSNNYDNLKKTATIEEKYHHFGYYTGLILKKITDTLKYGLNERILLIVPFVQEGDCDTTSILFGVTINPQFAFDIVEKAPANDNTASETFRQFWGKLSELRRFADGTICEAVHFKCETVREKRNIVKKIVDYIIEEKLMLKGDVISDQFERVINGNSYIASANEEASLSVKSAFDELSRILRDLKLPLSITTVQGTSDVFCHTDVLPPLPLKYEPGKKVKSFEFTSIFEEDGDTVSLPKYCAPIDCVIQFAMSSKWPNDIETFKCMRLEFFLEISKLLNKKHKINCKVNIDFLDVIYNGYVFRIRAYNAKEVVLLQKGVNEKGNVVYKDTEEAFKLNAQLHVLPSICGALMGVQLEYPSFGPCCTLIKRWVRSQLIDDSHISDTVINLLNASLYISNGPFEAPNLPQAGFLKFLLFLSKLDWNLTPIIVNFNNNLSAITINEYETTFKDNRSNFPSLYVITPFDDGKSVFTKKAPSEHILKRLALLASEMYNIINDYVINCKPLQIEQFFVPNFQGYDLLIHLKPKFNPLSSVKVTANGEAHNVDKNGKNFSLVPIVDFNPVEIYLAELRKYYGEFALFFHDKYGGDTIGVLWLQDSVKQADFKVSNVSGKMLVNNKLIVNRKAIVEGFHILGEGIIKCINLK